MDKLTEFKPRSAKSPAARAYVKRRVREENIQITLSELRKARGITQVQAAESLGTTQGRISKLEGSPDYLLSTLRKHIEMLGGHLEICAVFDDGERHELKLPETG